jgi:hypothetical protein
MSDDAKRGGPGDPVTRRDILRLATLLLTPGALAGCEIQVGSDGEPKPGEGQGGAGGGGITKPDEEGEGDAVSQGELQVLRPWDLCVLRVRPLGLNRAGNQLVAGTGTPRLVFTFPPQHLFEQAFPTSAPFQASNAPVKTFLSGESRVVVDVPASALPLPLTEDALLGALATFPMRLASGARLIPVAPMAAAQPSTAETALELPTRLLLSPLVPTGWVHAREAAAPQGNGQRVELWHSRFTPSPQGPTSPRFLRAIWSRQPTQPDALSTLAGAPMSDAHRQAIARQSTDFPTAQSTKPAAIAFRNLMLTPLGGYLDARGTWDPATLPPGGVTKWEHRATLGRDQFVEVTVVGRLFPFGHRALYTVISERKADLQKGYAYLEQRSFITILDELVDHDSQVADARARRGLPFRKLRILTRVTALLDAPNAFAQAPADLTMKARAFVPVVDRIPFRFEMEGEDQDGQLARFTAPAVFVDSLSGQPLQIARALYKNEATSTFVASWKFTALSPLHRFSQLQGQRVAFAPSSFTSPPSAPLGAAKARFNDSALPVLALLPKETPLTGPVPFMPGVDLLAVQMDAIDAISGGSGAALARVNPLYLDHGLSSAGNPCEALLEILDDPDYPTPKLDFGAQPSRVGGFLKPSMQVRAFSRSLGAMAVPTPPSLAAFTPANLFAGFADAKLFGVFSLNDVIEVAQTLAEVPRLIGQSLDRVRGLIADLYRLRELIQKLQGAASAISGALDALEQATSLQPLLALLDALPTLIPPGELFFAERKEAEALVERLRQELAALADQDELLKLLALAQRVKNGELLPGGSVGRYVYQPRLKALFLPGQSVPLFDPGTLTIVAEARTRSPGRVAGAEVSAALEDFTINLIPGFKAISLRFQRLAFRVGSGKKPDLDVKFEGLDFDGPMRFFALLKAFLPLDGFSDPPNLDVSPEGVTAGFSLALPTVAVGMFSLANIALSATFRVPFLGASPLSVSFDFASREQPFNLTVSLLGGGGYFGLEVSPQGFLRLESALEFGASLSLNLGVASGAVAVMAGIYFNLGDQEEARLEGFLRLHGSVSVLGLINASLDLHMALGWVQGKVYGQASLSICIEILFFSKTVTLSYERRFSGTNDDPTFAEIMAPYSSTDRVLPLGGKVPKGGSPWEEYVGAFAPEGA